MNTRQARRGELLQAFDPGLAGYTPPPDQGGDQQRLRIAADLLAALANPRYPARNIPDLRPVQVQLVGVSRRQPPGHLWPVAAHDDPHSRSVKALGFEDQVVDLDLVPMPRRATGSEGASHDLERLLQELQPLADRRERISEAGVLPLVPA